jgi:hypothetical protein
VATEVGADDETEAEVEVEAGLVLVAAVEVLEEEEEEAGFVLVLPVGLVVGTVGTTVELVDPGICSQKLGTS